MTCAHCAERAHHARVTRAGRRWHLCWQCDHALRAAESMHGCRLGEPITGGPWAGEPLSWWHVGGKPSTSPRGDYAGRIKPAPNLDQLDRAHLDYSAGGQRRQRR
jgi:hypothetical protein